MKTGQRSVPLERPYIGSWDTDGKTVPSAPLVTRLWTPRVPTANCGIPDPSKKLLCPLCL